MLKFRRVTYGKKNTPDEWKEYRIKNIPNSPVGTVSEILQMIKDQNLDVEKISLEELDGSIDVIELKKQYTS